MGSEMCIRDSHDPWLLAQCARAFGGPAPDRREEVIDALGDYLARCARDGIPVKRLTRHVLGLFQGQPGARKWRRFISENAHRDDSNARILYQALDTVREVAAWTEAGCTKSQP